MDLNGRRRRRRPRCMLDGPTGGTIGRTIRWPASCRLTVLIMDLDNVLWRSQPQLPLLMRCAAIGLETRKTPRRGPFLYRAGVTLKV